MRECASCGRWSEQDQDFCPCGDYLRWEPTGATPLLARPSAPTQSAAGASTSTPPATVMLGPDAMGASATPMMTPAVTAAQVVLTLTSETGDWLADPTFTVEPGAAVSFSAHVRNHNATVEHFNLSVEGIPAGWWSVATQTLQLLPFGSEGPCEDDAVFTLHPPKDSAAAARAWPIRVVAHSRDREVARVAATLTISPFEAVETEATPARRRGRRRARYRLELHNHGNAALRVAVSARDDGERCRFRISPSELEVSAGASAHAAVTVRARRPILFGQPAEHALELVASPAGSGPGPSPCRVTWTQRPWLPSGLKRLLPLAAIVVAAVLLLHVRVPAVRGLPIDKAERKLDAAHLKWNPPVQQRSKQPVGTVLDSIPRAGASRWRGARVTLIIATNDGRAEVPGVRGRTYAQAIVALAKAGYRAGGAAPADGAKAKVAEQVPKAKTRWPRSRPVELFFARPKQPEGHRAAKVAVPALAGATAAEATHVLRSAGLRPRPTREISVKPAGTLLGTQPSSGTLKHGAPIQVRVSAGFPQLAGDDGRRIVFIDGISGERRQRAHLAGGGEQTQPTWLPNGLGVTYRSGSTDRGRIWISDPAAKPGAEPHGGRALTDAGFDDRRPAVSPDGAVVAFVRGASRTATHRLCFVRVAGGAPSCLRAVAGGVSRPVWSPDGRAILVRTVDGRLLQLVSRRPASPAARSWQSKGVLPLEQLGQVQAVAWSARGELAITVDPGAGGRPTAFRARDVGLSRLAPISYAGLACEVTWRPDGKELVIAGRTDDHGAACPDTLGRDRGAATRLRPDGSANVALGDGLINPAFRPLALG